jgi:hypothetical protein
MLNGSPQVQGLIRLKNDIHQSKPDAAPQSLAMNDAGIEGEPAQLQEIAAPSMNPAVPRDQATFGALKKDLQEEKTVVQLVTDPATKLEAQQRHLADQQRVYTVINQAAVANVPPAAKPSRAKLLKNTAELLQNNFARLVVMSRTHADPALRAGGEIGYFDLTVAYPNTGGDYNLAKDNHIFMAPENEQGHADQYGEIRFLDPSGISDENIKGVLIHEMQHLADYHSQNYKQPALDENAGASAVNGYQTEFRAYWLGGIFGDRKHLGTSYDRLGFSFMPASNERKVPSGDLLTPNFTTAFKNQRQESIFWHLVGGKSYAYILAAYQKSLLFRNMVHKFTLPSGGNLLNSRRINQILSDVLLIYFETSNYRDYVGKLDDSVTLEEYERQRAALKVKIDAAYDVLNRDYLLLDREDLEFLNDRTASEPFWALAQQKLGQQFTKNFYDRIQGKTDSLRHDELLKSLGL